MNKWKPISCNIFKWIRIWLYSTELQQTAGAEDARETMQWKKHITPRAIGDLFCEIGE